jgi:Uma2 family endonuclease
MQAKRPSYLTPKEYLEMERLAPSRNEYYAGAMYAMAGASRRHVFIVTNIVASLGGQLKGGRCSAFANDLRVKVSTHGLYTYPDVGVVCGKGRYEDKHGDTLLNPTVIIEVISDSTESYDRGRKFEMYRTLESLTDYLLVAQDEPLVEHFSRMSDGRWALSEHKGMDAAVAIASIDCALALADIYDKIDFDADRPALRLVKEPATGFDTDPVGAQLDFANP